MHYVDGVLAAEFGYLLLQEWIEDLGRKLSGVSHGDQRTYIGDMSKILRSPRKNNRSVLDNYQSSSTPANPQQNELNQLVSAQSNPGQTVLGVSTPTDPTVQARITALTASLGAAGLDTAKAYAKKVQLGANWFRWPEREIWIAEEKPAPKGRFPRVPTMFMEVTRHFYPFQLHSSPPDSISGVWGCS